jgi:ABC-type branched-subunit amino acid transport system ATPase component
VLVQRLVFPQTWMYKTFAGSRKVPSPLDSSSLTVRYYVVLAVFVAAAVVVTLIGASRLGRMLRGIGGSHTAVSTLGLSTSVTKIIVFCVSAMIAALGGVMYGMVFTNVDGGTAPFQPYNSFVLLAVLIIAPFREPLYAVVAGISAVIPAFFTGHTPTLILNGLFGLFAIIISMQGGQPPVPRSIRSLVERLGGRVRRRQAIPEPTAPTVPSPRLAAVDTHDQTGLEIEGLHIRFGGLVAVDDVDLSAPLGTITGLIGPNGAGKTSTFNSLSGLNREVTGRVRFRGVDVARLGPAARGRLGLGRTFQRMELCDSLSVFDNVALGNECPRVGRHLIRQVLGSRSAQHDMTARTFEALELCGVADLADRQASELSTGQRRLVELARCLAGPFSMLLLDEPSSGLDRRETERFGVTLRHVTDVRGCGILLVEHDMSLVMTVCSRIYVLDFGKLIFEGTPSAVADSPIVRDAYLGEGLEDVPGGNELAEVVTS